MGKIKPKPIILIGTGGHSQSCIDLLHEQNFFVLKEIIGKEFEISKKIFNKFKVKYTDKDFKILSKKYKYAIIGVGQINSNIQRVKIFKKLKKNKFVIPSICSKFARVSKFSKIGEGTIIMHGAIIGAGVIVGKNCIINSNALIEHGSIIGNNTHISTSVTINGEVNVGSNCFVGSGSIIKQQTKVKNNTFIKMGSIIYKSI